MAEILKISESEIRNTIANGEFSSSITSSKQYVGIILTQDWCPQWTYMERWIETMPNRDDLDLYLVKYNRECYFEEFMSFKENCWKNDIVPYVRYYKNGILTCTSNAISLQNFLNKMGLK